MGDPPTKGNERENASYPTRAREFQVESTRDSATSELKRICANWFGQGGVFSLSFSLLVDHSGYSDLPLITDPLIDNRGSINQSIANGR